MRLVECSSSLSITQGFSSSRVIGVFQALVFVISLFLSRSWHNLWKISRNLLKFDQVNGTFDTVPTDISFTASFYSTAGSVYG
jgi:hypothetical protein